MSEGDFDQVNSIRDQEYVGDGGAIHFEPGLHYGFGEVTKSIDSGDLSKHCWNDEVGERLSSYGPQILAIDSLAPVAGKYLVNGDYGYEDKRWVWTWMPDRPKNFNEKGEVLVIAGDTNYQGVGEQLKTNLKEFKDQDRLGNLSLSKDEKEANAFLGKAFAEGAITASVAGLVTSALIAAYEKQNERPGAENGSHKFSRRKFLKVAGGGAAVALGIGGGRTAAAYGSALAPNSALQEISDKVLDLTQGTDFFSKSWLNGRTALLISKTNAVMEQGLTPSNGVP